jgi:FkbM family methyltransferase
MPKAIRRLAQSAIHLLKRDHKYFLFREIAHDLGIASVTANGPIGLMEGSLDDWTIFRRYVHGGAWETRTSHVCIDYFKRYGAGTFVDVGANIGMVFVPVVREAGCFGIAIDASPTNFSYLATNCLRNLDFGSYKLNQIAVGDRAGKVKFDTSSSNFGDHKISEVGTIEVDLMRFDDLYNARDFARPVLVKLDIQGAEPEFFAGATNLLAVCDAMVLEYSPFGEKGYDWIGEFDRKIIENFSRMLRYDRVRNHHGDAEKPEVVNQNALDGIKRSIAARQWHDPREGHENLLLLRASD